ncbi:hypothetical protein DL96DRAFT_1623110 [Flagelloscypha sp. PMI_526]|nr:hypothetical protein DL96DRAFT_1623110 [Flagelloscypha sp. PMI_526]
MLFLWSNRFLCFFIALLALASLVLAESDTDGLDPDEELLCTPVNANACEPCPLDALNQPYCQPFGNRRLMHCSPLTPPDHSENSQHSTGEVLAWSACGRIPNVERRDYFEFILCNFLFAAVAIFIVWARERKMRLGRARVLAARIGLVGRGAV